MPECRLLRKSEAVASKASIKNGIYELLVQADQYLDPAKLLFKLMLFTLQISVSCKLLCNILNLPCFE